MLVVCGASCCAPPSHGRLSWSLLANRRPEAKRASRGLHEDPPCWAHLPRKEGAARRALSSRAVRPAALRLWGTESHAASASLEVTGRRRSVPEDGEPLLAQPHAKRAAFVLYSRGIEAEGVNKS